MGSRAYKERSNYSASLPEHHQVAFISRIHCSFIHLSSVFPHTVHTSDTTSVWYMSVNPRYSNFPCGTYVLCSCGKLCCTTCSFFLWLGESSVPRSSVSVSAPPCTAGPIRNPRARLTRCRGSGSDKFTTKPFCEEYNCRGGWRNEKRVGKGGRRRERPDVMKGLVAHCDKCPPDLWFITVYGLRLLHTQQHQLHQYSCG